MSRLDDIRKDVDLGVPEWCSSAAGIQAIKDRAHLLTLVDEAWVIIEDNAHWDKRCDPWLDKVAEEETGV